MGKSIFLWTALMAVMLLPAGCTDDDRPDEQALREITIRVGMPEMAPETRLAYSESKDKGLRFTWENTVDQLAAAGFDAEGTFIASSDFSLASGAGTSTGTFKGSPVPGAVNYVVYYKNDNLKLSEGLAHPDFSHQVMKNASVMEKNVMNYVYMRSFRTGGDELVSAADFEAGNFQMKMVCSILKFELKIPEKLQSSEGVKQLLWTSNAGTAKAKSVRLDLIPVGNAKTLTCYVCFEDMDLEPGGTFAVTIGNDDVSCSFEAVSVSGKKYTPGGRAKAVISSGWK